MISGQVEKRLFDGFAKHGNLSDVIKRLALLNEPQKEY